MIRRPPRSTLFSLHDALPISELHGIPRQERREADFAMAVADFVRSEEHTSELQSRLHLVCRLLLEKKNQMLAAAVQREPRDRVRRHCCTGDTETQQYQSRLVR